MKKQRKLNGGAKMGFLFALPAAIYMMVFIGYPMIQNLILSFKNVDVYSFAQPQNQVFVGLKNYIELFTSGNSNEINCQHINIYCWIYFLPVYYRFRTGTVIQ